jgi:DNA-binding GntR family transcriptional regulator
VNYRDHVADDDQRTGEPPYLRIAADLRRRIEDGELRPGDALPSINRIAQEWGCAKTTAAKALNLLKAEGLARGVQGWGTIVTTPAERKSSAS